jgi:hypothetical protein
MKEKQPLTKEERMRTVTSACIGLFVCSCIAYGDVARYAIPVKDEVPVYANKTRKVFEQPLFFVGKNERLPVLALEKNMIRIENSFKQVGWLESSTVTVVSTNRSFEFGEAEVPGYGDPKLSPTQIIDGPEAIELSLNLNRSFADALRENVDQESVERQCGK